MNFVQRMEGKSEAIELVYPLYKRCKTLCGVIETCLDDDKQSHTTKAWPSVAVMSRPGAEVGRTVTYY
jgi:hypothetical protein